MEVRYKQEKDEGMVLKKGQKEGKEGKEKKGRM